MPANSCEHFPAYVRLEISRLHRSIRLRAGQPVCTFCAQTPRPGPRTCDDPVCQQWMQRLLERETAEVERLHPKDGFLPGEPVVCACGTLVPILYGYAVLPSHRRPGGALCEALCRCKQLAGPSGQCEACLVAAAVAGSEYSTEARDG